MYTDQLLQITFGSRPGDYTPGAAYSIDKAVYQQAEDDQQKALLKLCPEGLWHNGSYAAGCPRPILIGKHHQQQMHDLHEALTIAIIDIVQRWWRDVDALFPERMPLEPEEEELLKVSM